MYGWVLCLVAVVSAIADSRSLNGRIIGGQGTSIERFPHQASLQLKDQHFCGGAIVTKRLIISASHCFPNQAVVRFVKARVGSSNHNKGGKIYNVVKVDAHPRKSIYDYDVDVAIVHVASDIEFSGIVQPIRIVSAKDQPKPGDILTVSGWGVTKTPTGIKDDSPLSDALKALDFPMLKNDYCRKYYISFITKFTDNMICGGGDGKIAASKGDSGGPLINNKNQLVGVVSWGHPMFPADNPSVFTSLASHEVRKFVEKYI